MLMQDRSAFRTVLGQHIFLDRYALKDADIEKTLVDGDKVVYHEDKGTEFGQSRSRVGYVRTVNRDGEKAQSATVEFVPTREGEEGEVCDCVPIRQLDRLLEKDPQQTWRRVAKKASEREIDPAIRKEAEELFYWALSTGRFVPGGRILAALGSGTTATSSNCFVLAPVKDSRNDKDGIWDRIESLSDIMSRGGGVGYNLSTLRPRNAPVRKVNGRSSGAVSWGELYSKATGIISQGGSRRGAGMFIIEDWHPDVLEFIESKKRKGKLSYANISVGISDAFMKAVQDDDWWNLEFPETNHPDYDKAWNGDLKAWKESGRPTQVWRSISAREMWDLICSSAHASAEPGVWFMDQARRMSNSYYYEEGRLICTNPCGEQALPGWGVCNLGHINLATLDDLVSSDGLLVLERTVKAAVWFLDCVIDIGEYPNEETKRQQKLERRVGMGTLGLAELLIKQKLKYGDEAIPFIDGLFQFIANTAYEVSAELAGRLGSFKAFDSEKVLESNFIRSLNRETREKIRENGLRNVSLLTQAPTGTVGTMMGTSTGIEPFFLFEWERTGRMGRYVERMRVLEEWHAENRNRGLHQQPLPEYFVHAMNIPPEEHVKVQAAIQRWTDNSVSKTINLPSAATVEDVKGIYLDMWRSGCKGGTVYRDKSRDQQVLHVVEQPKEKTEPVPVALPPAPPPKPAGTAPHPKKRHGVVVTKESATGETHITMTWGPEKEPLEVWLTHGKCGSDMQAMMEALGRMMSQFLRLNSPVSKLNRVKIIVKNLLGIGGRESFGNGKELVRSIPDAVAKALAEEYCPEFLGYEEEADQVLPPIAGAQMDLCPGCSDHTLTFQAGCEVCINPACGHSKCK